VKDTPRLHGHCHCPTVSRTRRISTRGSKASGSECRPCWGGSHANSTGIRRIAWASRLQQATGALTGAGDASVSETVPQVCAARHGAPGPAANAGTQEGIGAIFTDHSQAGCDFILPLRCRPPAVCSSPEAGHHLPPAQPPGKALPRGPPALTPRVCWQRHGRGCETPGTCTWPRGREEPPAHGFV